MSYYLFNDGDTFNHALSSKSLKAAVAEAKEKFGIKVKTRIQQQSSDSSGVYYSYRSTDKFSDYVFCITECPDLQDIKRYVQNVTLDTILSAYA